MYSIQAVVKIFYLSLQLFLNWSKCLSFPAQHNGWWRSEFIILKGFCQFCSDNLLLAHLPIRHITVMTAWARCVPQPRARRTLLNLAPGASLLHIFHLIHNFHNFCLFHNFHLIYLIHILHLIHLTPCQLMLLLLSVLCIIYCGGWLTMTVMNSNMKHGNCCVLCYFSWQSAIFWREIHKTQGRSYIIQYSADSSWSGPSPDSGKNLDDLHHTLVGHPTPGSKERCESEIVLDVLWR